MVAIITGKGAGIENSSVSVLGGSGQLGGAGLGRSGESVYLNAATGNLTLTTVDEMLVGRGPDAVASRTYNSLGAWDGDNGDDWRASVYRRVYDLLGTYGAASSTVKRTDWDGSESVYTWDASYTDGIVTGAYVSTDGAGAYDTLTRSGSTWTWTEGSSRVVETYDEAASGRITGKADASGNAISYTYTGSLLTQVTSANGEYTLLVYGGTGGTQLQYLETHTASPTATTTRTYYEYDGNGRLSAVKVNLAPSDNSKTTGTNYTTSYTYDSTSGKVATITQDDGTLVSFTYTSIAGVYRVTGISETIVTGTTRNTTISYDTVNRVTTITDALSRVTKLTYDADGNLLSIVMPPSGTGDPAPSMDFTYEGDGDVATMTSAGNTVTYAYDTHGNRTLERDSLGNTVVRSYSDNNLYATPNDPSYWNGVSANLAQVTGTPAGTAVSVTATATGLAFARQITTPVPVVVGQTLTFTVDLVAGNSSIASFGLLGNSSLYGANADSSAVIISGPGSIARVGGAAFQVTGLAAGAVTRVRITRTFTQAESVTSRIFVGSSATGTTSGNSIIFANAEVARSATNQLLTETRYTVPDPDGAGSGVPSGSMTTRYVYDSASRLRFTVDGEGLVTEYAYDSYGQQTSQMVYAGNSYSVSGLDDTASITESALATWVSGISDKSNAQRTETSYDFRGNISQVTSYSKLLSTGAFDTASERSQTIYVYSSHGELLSKQVDGTGVTQVYAYDGLSRITLSKDVAPGTNLYTNANATSFWATANANITTSTGTALGTALQLTASTVGTNLTLANSQTSQIPVVAGETLSFTVQLLAGTFNSASLALRGTTSVFGAAADSTIEILSGPSGASASRLTGAAFQVNGLSTTEITTVRITRTFTQAENVTSYVYVGSATSGTAKDNSIVFANATAERVPQIRTTYTDNGASGSAVAVTLANGLVQTSTYDRAGNLTTYAESGSGVTTATTSYKYDLLGRLRIIADPTGQRQFFFYDNDGRKVADIDGDGSVTEYRYDAAGRVTRTTSYATQLTSTQLASLVDANGDPTTVAFSTVRPGAVYTADRWAWTVYDLAGRVARTIDGTGAITSYTYDGASRLVSSTEHAVRLSATEINYLKTVVVAAPNLLPNSQFVTTAGWFTGWNPHNIVASGSPFTGVTGGKSYIKTNFTATAASPQGASISTDETWVPVTAGQRYAVQTGVEAQGPIGSVWLTLHWLDANGTWLGNQDFGLLSGVQAFDTKIAGFATAPAGAVVARFEVYMVTSGAGTGSFSMIRPTMSAASAAQSTQAAFTPTVAADSTNDRTVRSFYDNAGRLIGTLDAEGYISKIEYDKAGRRVHTIARKTKPTTTTGSFATIFASAAAVNAEDIHNWWIYDARGLVRATIDAEGTVTRMDYTAAGDLSQQTRGQKIAAGTLTTYMTTPPTLASLPAAGGGEILSVTAWTYNGWGQPLTQVTTLTGSTTTTTSYSYDIMRNLVSTTTQSGGTDPRTYAKRYDRRGRLTSELSGDGNAALAALGSNPTQTQIDNLYLQYGWSYTYDTADRLIAKTAPSGTSGVAGAKTLYYYNADDSLAYEVDALGQVTGYVYNAFGERADVVRYADTVNLSGMTGGIALTQVTGSSNLVASATLDSATHTDFNLDGTVKQVTDPLSNVSTFTYNAFGELASSSVALDNDGAGGAARAVLSENSYDRRGLLKQEKLNSVVVATYGYDAFGRAITLTNALSKSTTSNYDRKGRLTSTVDALGNTTTYTYDARDNLVAVKDALNNLTRYVYDKANRKVATIDAKGGLTTVAYDGDGRVIAERAYKNTVTIAGSVLEIVETNATYTAALAATHADDHVTRYAYDKDGQLRFAVDGLGHVVGYVNDANGNVVRTTAYDGTVDPGLADSSYTEGALKTLVDAFTSTNHRVTRSVYDATNRLSYSIDAIGQVSWFVYDAKGLLTKTVEFAALYTPTADPSLATMNSWRGTNANATNDRTTRAFYDRKGQLSFSIDALGYVTRSEYDKAGNVKKQTRYADAYSATDATTLDDLTTAFASPPSTARVTQFKYDAAGRLEETVDPEGYRTRLTLDAAGQITSSTQAYGTADASTTAYVYDDLGRVVKVTRANGTAEVTTSWFFYDAIGQQTAVVDGDNYLAVATYDAVGNKLTDKRYANAITGAFTSASTVAQLQALAGTNAADVTTSAAYDIFGRVSSTTDGRGSVVSSIYDKIDRVQSITQQMESGTTDDRVTNYTYDNFGGVVKTVDPRGNASFAYYDKLGRVTRQVDGEKYVTDTTYTRGSQVATVKRWANALTGTVTETTVPGNPAADATRDATTTFAYDKRDLLTSTTDAVGYTESYILNALGERTTVTNKLGGSILYAYDKRGLVLSETLPITTENSNGTTIDVVNSYRYDARGNRTKMVEAGTLDAYGNILDSVSGVEVRTTNYSYDKLDRVVQTTGDAVDVVNDDLTTTAGVVPTTRTTYDHRGNVTSTTDAAGATTWFAYDMLGRRTGQVDPLGTVQTWAYDKAGNVTTSRVFATPARLPATTGTLEMQVRRMYDLALGRQPNQSEIDNWVYRMTNLYPGPNALTSAFAEIIADSGVQARFPNAASNADFINAVYRYAFQRDATSDEVNIWLANIAGGWTRPQVLAFFSEHWDHVAINAHKMVVDQVSQVGATADYRLTTFTYDRSNRLLTTSVAGLLTGEWNGSAYAITGSTTITSGAEYDKAGNAVRQYDGRGNSAYTWYDKLGRQVAQVDAEKYLTVWERDAEGNAKTETRYANKVTGSFTTATDYTTLSGLLGTGATDANRVTTFTYDKNGRRLTESRAGVAYSAINASNGVATDSSGTATITYTYNGLDQVTSKAEAVGDATIYEYDAIGRLLRETGQSFTDYQGNTVTPRTAYSYDGLNNLSATRVQVDASGTNALDRVTSYIYGKGGRLASMTDAGGFTRNYYYDIAGRTVQESYFRFKSDGTAVTESQVTRYDLAGRAVTQTMARYNGSAWVFTSELAGNPAYDAIRTRYSAYGEITGRGVTAGPNATAAYQETFDYDAGGRLWRSNTGDGVLRFHVYDKAGNETLRLESAGADLSALTAANYTASIDSSGDTTTANAVTTISVYDKRGQATSVRQPDRLLATGASTVTVTTAKTYNAFGEVLSETNGRGYTTSFTYNTMGRMLSKVSPQVSVTAANGAISTAAPVDYYGYDLSGRLVSVIDANGNRTTRTLLAGTGHGQGEDPLVAKEFHADSGVAQTLYDVFGDARIVRNELYMGTNAADTDEVQTFDKLGRLTSVQHRGNFLTDNYTYDGLGQRITHWNSQLGSDFGVKERTDYDAQGRVVQTVQLGGDTTSYAYAWDTSLSTSGLADYDGWVKTTTNAAGVSMTEKQDYFGRVIGGANFGGVATTLTFDKAGRLATRTNTAGENLTYSWYNTGLQASVSAYTETDMLNNSTVVTAYGYDAAGNRVSESYSASGNWYDWYNQYGGTFSTSYESATATWDALNRMTAVADTGISGSAPMSVAYEYDARGNVVHMTASYRMLDSQGNVSTTSSSQDYWYAYDNMNRFTVTQGMLVKFNPDGTVATNGSGQYLVGDLARGVAGAGVNRYTTGSEIGYDKASRRTSAARTQVSTYSDWEYGIYYSTYTEQKELYAYRADGQLMRTDVAAGAESQDFTMTSPYIAPASAGNSGAQRAVFTRDGMGRVTAYSEYAYGTTLAYTRSAIYNDKSQVTWDQTVSYRSDGTFRSDTSYYYNAAWNGSAWVGSQYAGTYMGGTVTGTTSVNYKNNDNGDADDTSTFHQFTWGQDATLSYTVHDKNTGSSSNTLWTTSYTRDASGNLTSAYIADGRPRTVTLVNDAEGRVLQRDEQDNNYNATTGGDPKQLHYYFNGRRIGDISNNGTSNVDYVTSIGQHQAAPAGTGAFQNGATSGWSYADFDQSYDPINGLTYESTASSYTVVTGDTLTTIAQNLWGDASLWYLIAEANGLNGSETLAAGRVLTIPNKVHNIHHTSDTWRPYNPNEAIGDLSPTAPKPKKKPPCGMFGMIILAAIAIAVVVLTSGAAVAALSSAPGITGALSGFGAILGGTTGLSTAALVGIGAAAGAVGSMVSQAIGVGTGLQNKFSWKAVGMAAIGGAVGAGLGPGGLFGKAGAFANIGSKLATNVLRAVTSSALTQGIGVATGLQKKFSWAGVAAAGVGAAVGTGIAKAFKIPEISSSNNSIGDYAANLGKGAASMIANAATRSVIDGSDFGDNIMAALPDVIAQTIGDMLFHGVSGETGSGTTAVEDYAHEPAPAATSQADVEGEGIVVAGHPMMMAFSGRIGWAALQELTASMGGPDEADEPDESPDAVPLLVTGQHGPILQERLTLEGIREDGVRMVATLEPGEGIVISAPKKERSWGWKAFDALGFHKGGFFHELGNGFVTGIQAIGDGLSAVVTGIGDTYGSAATTVFDWAEQNGAYRIPVVREYLYAQEAITSVGHTLINSAGAVPSGLVHLDRSLTAFGTTAANGVEWLLNGNIQSQWSDIQGVGTWYGGLSPRERSRVTGKAGGTALTFFLPTKFFPKGVKPVGAGNQGVAMAVRGRAAAAEQLAINRAAVRAHSVTNARYSVKPPVVAAETTGSRLAADRIAGNAFRDDVAEALRAAGRGVETEVYKKTPFGPRYIDIEVRDVPGGKVIGGVETKLGGSRYTPSQRAKDNYLRIWEKYPVDVLRGPR